MGTTSNYSWPYPESTDPVADGAADIQALADAADTTGRAIQLATVQVFADSTARDTALSGIEIEGMFAFLQDTDVLTYWDGSAWQEFATGAGTANFTDTATGTYSSGGLNYKYLEFTASGTITIDQAGLCDILVVGGGGSGGQSGGGGGGAGGHLYATGAYLPVGTLTVTVGAGGAAVDATFASQGSSGLPGSPSQIHDYIVPGGGGGGGHRRATSGTRSTSSGQAGGSGGGASTVLGGMIGPNVAGSGLSGIGNDGGTNGGGGGGAGAAGSNGGSGNGGAGLANSITGSSVTRAGGGGGASAGTGGSGGGGAAAGSGTATSGTANTGGGGGGQNGSALSDASGSGGSGVVIIRVEV